MSHNDTVEYNTDTEYISYTHSEVLMNFDRALPSLIADITIF